MVVEKKMDPRCCLPLTLEMRLFLPSTEEKTDELLQSVVQRETVEEAWKSLRGDGKNEKCVEEVARDQRLRQRMQQTLSVTSVLLEMSADVQKLLVRG